MSKLRNILLIDDDPATNFLHKIIIAKEDPSINVICKQSAKEALVYLKTKTEGEHPIPELIFLDINMPGMNGWDFLNEYQSIDETQQAKKVIVMLTTSLDPFDRKRAEDIKEISDFRSKPLTSIMLRKVLEFNFPETFQHYG